MVLGLITMKASGCGLHKLMADIAVVAQKKVLLVKYVNTEKYDHQKGWFLPDDLLNHLEHPEDCARRILKEQVGMNPGGMAVHHIESFTGDDGTWHLIFHYLYEPSNPLKITPGKNIAASEWFDVKALPERSQFSHHGWGLDVLKKILRRGLS